MLGFAALVLIQLVFHRTAYPYQTRSDALLYFSYATLAFLAVQTIKRGSHIRKLGVVFTVYGTCGRAVRRASEHDVQREGVLDLGSGVWRLDLRPLCESQPLRRTDGDARSRYRWSQLLHRFSMVATRYSPLQPLRSWVEPFFFPARAVACSL